RALAVLDPAIVDWTPSLDRTAIGGLLYHLAAIEADWLYSDILETAFPPEVEALFPHEVRDEAGRLTSVTGLTLDQHLQRLDAVRVIFLNSLRGMTLAEFRRPRAMDDYDVTPEWVIHHLMQHEAEHRAEIAALR
ncbi:MAG TPA: DinB family protein, partial [Anaerolineales bacterium]|nr:DinB family protein [Anaerolineales bacterium]